MEGRGDLGEEFEEDVHGGEHDVAEDCVEVGDVGVLLVQFAQILL